MSEHRDREEFRTGPSAQDDLEYLKSVLGESSVEGIEIAIAEDYNERAQILGDALVARERMRQTMKRAASEAGIKLDDAEVAAWQPNEGETKSLRQTLTKGRKFLTMISGLGSYIADQADEANRQGVPLRPHQQNVLRAFGNFLVYGRRSGPLGAKSGLIEMPTGTGKTGVFANIVAALKHEERPDERIRVLVLVPTQIILDQTMGRHGERGFGKFAPHLNVGAYYQDEKDLDSDVVVMCNASFDRLMSQGKLPDFDAVIVDEAHTVIGEAMGEKIREYCSDKLTIGLTATPEFDEERTVRDLFEHEIYKMDLIEAVRGGLLAPVRAFLLKAEPKIDPRSLPEKRSERVKAVRAARIEARKEATITIIKESILRGVGTLVRCPAGDDIDHAVTFASRLRDLLVKAGDGLFDMRWITAEHIGGSYKRGTKVRRRYVSGKFDVGDIDALTYVKGIREGFDSPHPKAHVNIASTTSKVETIQTIGRALRLTFGPDGKPIEARIYDYEDPELGGRQYTCLDALQLANGQLLDHDPAPPIPRQRTKESRRTPAADIDDVTTTVVGQAALAHAAGAMRPSEEEIRAAVATQQQSKIPFADVCRMLGINPPTLRRMLGWPVSKNDDVEADLLEIIHEVYPGLKAADLPEDGFVSATQVVDDVPYPVRLFSLVRIARDAGIAPHRFTDNATQKVGFYFSRDQVPRLLEALRQHYRH